VISWFLLNIVIGIIFIEYQIVIEANSDRSEETQTHDQPHFELLEALKWKVYLSNKLRNTQERALSRLEIQRMLSHNTDDF